MKNSWKIIIFSLLKIILFCNSAILTQRNNHENISELLDNLMRGYDNSVRPDFGGPPAVIDVDIMVRSMGPISEVDMTYSMDCYFRQSWIDRRLAFIGAPDTLALSISMLSRIWKPDTYFYNGKQSYLHTITTPNKFVRLYQDGRVLYSSRLTIKAGCPMNLENFPMDKQRCPLKFGSFGYTTTDILYRWNRARITIAEDMKLSQFDLVDCPAENITERIKVVSDFHGKTQLSHFSEHSMLAINFHLQRHMGNFLIQVYGPCVLLVVLSWVSFWLNREATADRVSLGITTVLTMTFLGLEARTDLPKVPYPTALDFFVFLSFAFIFATIIQFAVVHYFTKYGSGECYFNREDSSDSESDIEDLSNSETKMHTITIGHRNVQSATTVTTAQMNNKDSKYFKVIPLSMCSIPITPIKVPTKRSWWLLPCIKKPIEIVPIIKPTTSVTVEKSPTHQHRLSIQNLSVSQQRHKRRRKNRQSRFNSVSKIDRASRIVFPVLFLIINLFYWWLYLLRSERLTNKSILTNQ